MKHKNRVSAFLMTLVMLISQFAGNALPVHATDTTFSEITVDGDTSTDWMAFKWMSVQPGEET